jgi:hypothetical protein
VARDLVIAEAICRHFWWHTLMLWPDELPRGSVVSLSLDDELVPCALVQRQLEDAAARGAAGVRGGAGSAADTPVATRGRASGAGGTTDGAGEPARGPAAAQPGAPRPVQVFVSPGVHGVMLMQAALQRKLIAAWAQSMEQAT